MVEILREQQTGTPLGGDIEHQGVSTGQLMRHHQVGFAELIQQARRALVVEVVPLPAAGFTAGRLRCQPPKQGTARYPQGGCALCGRGDGGDGATMGEHGEVLPQGHLPQQGREGTIGLRCAHNGWMERGAGVSQERGCS